MSAAVPILRAFARRRPAGRRPPSPTERPRRVSEVKDVIIIGAGARGNRVFADLIARHDTGFRTVGVVELDPRAPRRPSRRATASPTSAPSPSSRTSSPPSASATSSSSAPPTPPTTPSARPSPRRGTTSSWRSRSPPTSPTASRCSTSSRRIGNRIFVAHVLRYSPFFRAVKEIVDDGRARRHPQPAPLGERRATGTSPTPTCAATGAARDLSAPIILTKSSHDLDIIHWLVGKRARSVTSYGGLRYFTAAQRPRRRRRALRGLPLPRRAASTAPPASTSTSARSGPSTSSPLRPTPSSCAARRSRRDPTGAASGTATTTSATPRRCCLEFADGVHATFELQALTADNTRQLRILFDTAELVGDLHEGDAARSRHFTGREGRAPRGAGRPPRVRRQPRRRRPRAALLRSTSTSPAGATRAS